MLTIVKVEEGGTVFKAASIEVIVLRGVGGEDMVCLFYCGGGNEWVENSGMVGSVFML